MKKIKKYVAALLLVIKIFTVNGHYDRFDKLVATEFYHVPGFDLIAGSTEIELAGNFTDPKCDLVHWLLGFPPYK